MNQITEKEFLTRAKNLIADSANWTQGEFAKDENGYATNIGSVDAFCFCSLGALRRINRQLYDNDQGSHDLYENARNTLYAAMGDDIIGFNDSHTHEEVIAAFDQAIENA